MCSKSKGSINHIFDTKPHVNELFVGQSTTVGKALNERVIIKNTKDLYDNNTARYFFGANYLLTTACQVPELLECRG